MGRMRALFCASCLGSSSDRSNNDTAYNTSVDVSHLATAHIASNVSSTVSSSPRSTPIGEDLSENTYNDIDPQPQLAQALQNGCAPRPGSRQSPAFSRLPTNGSDRDANSIAPPFQQYDRNQSSPRIPGVSTSSSSRDTPSRDQVDPSRSPPPIASSSASPMAQPPPPPPPPQPNDQRAAQHARNGSHAQEVHRRDEPVGDCPSVATTKLSYDVISVREPLAKILAERQLQQSLQLQRQILGEHEYIEVYGDRGSSCFYEEIAGSTASSATYDQIGALSNHNYQVLINAYAVSSNPNGVAVPGLGTLQQNMNAVGRPPPLQEPAVPRRAPIQPQAQENPYDETDGPINEQGYDLHNDTPQPSTSSALPTAVPTTSRLSEDPFERPYATCADTSPSAVKNVSAVSHQSMPVYSVINKARRNNAIIRATVNNNVDCRPPQPPPKNLFMNQAPPTSAIPLQPNHESTHMSISPHNNIGNHELCVSSSLKPTTSSYINNHSDIVDNSDTNKTSSPKPPPRFSKMSMLHATDRPLPLPDNHEKTETRSAPVHNLHNGEDQDQNSADDGYELLCTNFDDDQIDVGYERIREPNRYSGGSMSSQFCPLPALDNGGYESVQPIYSSPSNALVEPNYEAIGPATASELAAAATARLNAAASAYEFLLKRDQL